MENQQSPEIVELLKLNGIKSIQNFDEFKKYFDVTKLDEDGTPEIVCENKVVIIFDNQDYNETYLIDLYLEYLKTHLWLKDSIEVIYIDSFDVRKKLFAESVYNKQWDANNLMPRKEFEKKYLIPGIMTINPIENQISFHSEKMTPLTLEHVTDIFKADKIEE